MRRRRHSAGGRQDKYKTDVDHGEEEVLVFVVVVEKACFRIGNFGLLVAPIYNYIVMHEGRTSSSDRLEYRLV